MALLKKYIYHQPTKSHHLIINQSNNCEIQSYCKWHQPIRLHDFMTSSTNQIITFSHIINYVTTSTNQMHPLTWIAWSLINQIAEFSHINQISCLHCACAQEVLHCACATRSAHTKHVWGVKYSCQPIRLQHLVTSSSARLLHTTAHEKTGSIPMHMHDQMNHCGMCNVVM